MVVMHTTMDEAMDSLSTNRQYIVSFTFEGSIPVIVTTAPNNLHGSGLNLSEEHEGRYVSHAYAWAGGERCSAQITHDDKRLPDATKAVLVADAIKALRSRWQFHAEELRNMGLLD